MRAGPLNHTSHYGPIVVDADAATITLDCAVSDKHTITLGGNRTLALANPQIGQVILVEVVQPATGGPFSPTFWAGIRWSNGTAPTLATVAGKADLLTFYVRAAGSYAGALSVANY